jgi:predicted transport protein
MPLFHIDKNNLTIAKPINFNKEKEIQTLIENNLEVVFNCKFIATEFSTGPKHAGRIDTLALSEDNNPVIIEYKKIASSELVNQSLYYLDWINDHNGDFQIAVNKKLGKNIEIDWNDIRVICIAPEYKKFDLYAVRSMGANIELWQYKLYNTNTLYLEEVFRKSTVLISSSETDTKDKNPVIVEAGKKAAQTRQTGSYTFDEHSKVCDDKTKKILQDLRDFILNIDEAVEETPKKFYIAYKVSQNFVCIEARKNKILLFLKLNPKEINIPENGRDVSNIGHYGTGDFEMSINNPEEMEKSKKYIKSAFENIGG